MTKRYSGKNKKPTMMEVKEVISSIIEEIKNVKYAVRNIDTVLSGYIKYKNDDKAYSSWLEKQIKESTEKANEKAKK